MADGEADRILSGERIFFSEHQLDALSVKVLTESANSLGATIVSSADDATIIIDNPGSPLYKPVTGTSSSPALHVPYHWLSVCRIKQARVALEDLHPRVPFMQHKSTAKVGVPVHIYVSKNVHRDPRPLDQPMWVLIGNSLAVVGAIIVGKRAEADVLVVDLRSDFYRNKIKPEIAKFKRWHQGVVERPWVDDCLGQGQFIEPPPNDGDDQGDRHVREDSFAEEDVVERPRPGRPAGKTRTEYTPQDDDFLCRYLASYHPRGSWASRKTYQDMMEESQFSSITQRHTAQSWHERFKKNSIPFERRVQRYIAEGIDYKLETTTEQIRAKRRAKELKSEPAASGVDDGAVLDESTTSNAAAKRKLVDSDTDDVPVEKKTALVGRTARIEALGAIPDVGGEVEMADAWSSGLAEQLEDAGRPTAAEPAIVEDSTEAEATAEGAAQLHFVPDPDILPVSSTQVETTMVSQVTESAGGGRTETTVFQATREVVTTPVPATPVAATPEPETRIRGVSTPTRPAVDAPSTPGAAASQPAIPQTAPARLPRPGQTLPVPVSPSVNPPSPGASPAVRQRTQATGIPREATSAQSPRAPATPPTTNRISSATTVSPTRRTLDHAIARSRRKQEAHQAKVPSSVDTVSRKPARPMHSPAPAAYAPSDDAPAKPPTERLTPAQRAERFAAGARISAAARDAYRQRITEFTAKYNVSVSELAQIVNEIRRDRSSNGDMFWQDVEQGLQIKFGF